MSRTVYRFRNEWSVPARPGAVFDLLADVGGYPAWWPQVQAVGRVDEDTALVVCRSLLPYSLELTLTRAEEDRRRGVLEAVLAGHLDGWSRWTLRDRGGSTDLVYEQEVVTPGLFLAAATRVARPVLVANHGWMMRGGRRGMVRAVVQGRSSAGR